MRNTWAADLNPTYHRFENDDEVKILFGAAMLAARGENDVPLALMEQFLCKIIAVRIEVMKLPITFKPSAYMAMLAYCKGPGDAVVLLIDCLNAFEGKEVNAHNIVDLYPDGFYDHKTLEKYIDEYMKPRKVKWSDVYISKH